jgi:hypothetical protein
MTNHHQHKKRPNPKKAEKAANERFVAGPFPWSKAAAKKMGMGRPPRQRGMGITRAPSSKRLPKHVMLQHILNPQRRYRLR